jgi:hypothetical protein
MRVGGNFGNKPANMFTPEYSNPTLMTNNPHERSAPSLEANERKHASASANGMFNRAPTPVRTSHI